MARAKELGADVVAFAELSFMRFFPAQRRGNADVAVLAEAILGDTTRLVAAKAQELSLVCLINLYERTEHGCFDTSVVIDADGEIIGKTRMLHVTDFEGFHEKDYYTPGDCGLQVFETRAGRIGIAICYDRH